MRLVGHRQTEPRNEPHFSSDALRRNLAVVDAAATLRTMADTSRTA
jgi:hypothetical protein